MANAATVQQEWLLVDAENEVLGRFASKVAMLVRGKHKTTFTPLSLIHISEPTRPY